MSESQILNAIGGRPEIPDDSITYYKTLVFRAALAWHEA
jgi:hypothetical protein